MGCDIFILLIMQPCITVADPFLEGTAWRCLTGRPSERRREKLDRPSRNYTSTGWKAAPRGAQRGTGSEGGAE